MIPLAEVRRLRKLVELAQNLVTILPVNWQMGAFEIVLALLLNREDEDSDLDED